MSKEISIISPPKQKFPYYFLPVARVFFPVGLISTRVINERKERRKQATRYAFANQNKTFASINMGCAPSKRVENTQKDALQKGNKAENEILQGPPTFCSHRQDVSGVRQPVAEDENGNNLISLAKINDQAILGQNTPINITKLDTTTEIAHENDGFLQNLTNMDVNGETVLNGGVVDKLLILHFNDVYNIEPREKEPVGGAARFASKIATFKPRNPLTLFSGDALNPSMSEYIDIN